MNHQTICLVFRIYLLVNSRLVCTPPALSPKRWYSYANVGICIFARGRANVVELVRSGVKMEDSVRELMTDVINDVADRVSQVVIDEVRR